MEYSDLEALLQADVSAQAYFSNLPDYVRSQIQSRAGGVHSLANLRDYADNLTQGDD